MTGLDRSEGFQSLRNVIGSGGIERSHGHEGCQGKSRRFGVDVRAVTADHLSGFEPLDPLMNGADAQAGCLRQIGETQPPVTREILHDFPVRLVHDPIVAKKFRCEVWDAACVAAAVMAVDLPGLYYRAFHALPSSLRGPDGRPNGAIRGSIDMLTTLVRQRSPELVVLALDADWRPAWRVALVPGYKAHRARADGTEDAPDDLTAQIPVLVDVLERAGLAIAAVPGAEADDVLAGYAAHHRGPVEIVTGDRDLFQLVDDEREVRVLYIGAGLAKLSVMDGRALAERYGVDGPGYLTLAVLRGDPSDGLTGVPGIGERTAATLAAQFGTVEAVLAAAQAQQSGLRPAVATALQSSADQVLAAQAVTRVRPVAPPLAPRSWPPVPADGAALAAAASAAGVSAHVSRLLQPYSSDE